jgi:hypothetical protein
MAEGGLREAMTKTLTRCWWSGCFALSLQRREVVCRASLFPDRRAPDAFREEHRGMKHITGGTGLSDSGRRVVLQRSSGRRLCRTFGMEPRDLVRSV